MKNNCILTNFYSFFFLTCCWYFWENEYLWRTCKSNEIATRTSPDVPDRKSIYCAYKAWSVSWPFTHHFWMLHMQRRLFLLLLSRTILIFSCDWAFPVAEVTEQHGAQPTYTSQKESPCTEKVLWRRVENKRKEGCGGQSWNRRIKHNNCIVTLVHLFLDRYISLSYDSFIAI